MHLLPHEIDKLTLAAAGFIAQKRLARGLVLNVTEATALIAYQIVELARDGIYTVSNLMQKGREMLGTCHVLPGVPEMLHDVQVEARFLDGTKLVTIHHPISSTQGNLELALYGSFLPIPKNVFPAPPKIPIIPPGAFDILPGTIKLCPDRSRRALLVTNNGDRPIQVGSHYNFSISNLTKLK